VSRVRGAVDRRRSRVHGGTSGRCGQERGGASQAQGTLGATGLRSSPARARDEEGDEAKPAVGSPEHERRR
jgi:hypothetical protein